MDPRLLRHYENELRHLREMGAEFAQEYPKIASRLGMEGFECADPYVERLLEGFAFLTARVQLKLDSEYATFTRHLLEIVFPHYLAPTPSAAVVAFNPDLAQGSLAEGYCVPRGSLLRSILGKGDQTACEYRTCQDTTLWPIELTEVDYLSSTGAITALGVKNVGKAKAAIKLRLKATAGLNFGKIALDRLPIFLTGPGTLPRQIYEEVFAQGLGLALRGQGDDWRRLGGAECLRPMGFDEDEALLPVAPETFQGYRLLTEYFTFPERFQFFELSGIRGATRGLEQKEIEILILLGRSRSGLESTLDKNFFRLFCAPAINLFPKRMDRVHLSDQTNEYHLVPDRSRAMDFEVYQLQNLVGIGSAEEGELVFAPFYAISDESESEPREAFYMIRRLPRLVSSKQQRKGQRSSYIGSEVFISLVDRSQAPFSSNLKQLAPVALCTNRDLPLTMPVGKGATDFTLPAGGPVKSLRCVAGPTKPMPSFAEGESAWRLINHLSLNYLSLNDNDSGEGAAALRELLSLYALRGNLRDAQLVAGKEIEALQSVTTKRVVRRLPDGGPAAVARGLEITLAFEEGAYDHSGLFLLGALLEQFFTRYVSINSFTETAIVAGDRGEVMRWPTRFGCRRTV